MSFFDKLKNSMGVETSEEEEKEGEEEEKKEKEKSRKEKESEAPKVKKIQIKGEKEESKPASASPVSRASAAKDEWFQPEGELAVDVFQTDNEIVIQSTIAGMKPEDIDLGIEGDVVTISGERKNPNTEGEPSYFYQECYWGPFSRQIILPEEVDFGQAEATMKDGIFTLRLPKLLRQKMRKIKVRG